MKNVIGMIAVAGLASVAMAQGQTELRYEARIANPGNNTGWTSNLNAAPGDTIEVRAVVSYIGQAAPVALGQIVFQPVQSNWVAGDTLITTAGTPGNNGIGPVGGNTNNGFVNDEPGAYGRITPWAANATTTSTFLRGHVQNVSGGTFLRIARADVTNFIGVGASSGAGAANNTNGGGGVSIAQGNIGPARPTNFPPAVLGTSGLVVFKYGFTLSSDTALRTITVTTPAQGFGRSTAASNYGADNTRWFSSSSDSTPGSIVTSPFAVDAVINVVPTPASMALLGLGGLMVARRRR
ncbi:MAG: PEP-CTERM sorting domain-containing protein [Planctomycetota bacterium]|nr:PEP-CTERM sorting domain-containing protein [Planctomycetota bacterium]